MYNRYIRSPQGDFTRIPEDEPPKQPPESPCGPPPPPEKAPDTDSSLLRRLFGKLGIDTIDSGDLLLLLILFLLFSEGEERDEELLIALGLLLIL